MRLDRYLTASHEGSRSEVKDYIRKGLVTVNGEVITDCSYHVGEADEVCLRALPVTYREHVYYMLNKPAGVLSATEDDSTATVIDLFPENMRKTLFPVGRLDKDSVGLLIITDDGALSHRLMSPKNHVAKRYFIRTDAPLDGADIAAFEKGITLADETSLLPAKLEISADDPSEAVVTICEGKYHQVKRMVASRGKKVTYLKRLSIGGLDLDPALKEGEYRELSGSEIINLKDQGDE